MQYLIVLVAGRANAFKKEKKVSHELHQLSLIFIKFEKEWHEFYLIFRIRGIENLFNWCLFV